MHFAVSVFFPFHVSPYRRVSTSQPFEIANKVSTLCVRIGLGTWFLAIFLPPSFDISNLTPLFRRSRPASHLSNLPLPKLRGPPPCTCTLPPGLTCVARLACTFVAIYFVDAPPVVAGFALAVVQIHLTIKTCRFA